MANDDWTKLKGSDAKLMIAATVHSGDKNVNYMMKQYNYGRTDDGRSVFNLEKVWQKLQLAARAIAAIENPQDVACVAMKPETQRACLKFARYTQAFPFAGRFTPGTFTNQIQRAYREPRLLIVNDVMADQQAILEASYVNIPVIAFCDSDSSTRFVDIVIPTNTKSNHAVGLMWWLLTREVLRMRGSQSRDVPWDVMVDLFFYRKPEEIEKEEEKERMEKECITSPPAPNATVGGAGAGGMPHAGNDFGENWDNEGLSAPTGFGSAPFGTIGYPPPAVAAIPVPAKTETGDWGVMANEDWNEGPW